MFAACGCMVSELGVGWVADLKSFVHRLLPCDDSLCVCHMSVSSVYMFAACGCVVSELLCVGCIVDLEVFSTASSHLR